MGNGKVLLNGPWAISFYCILGGIYGIIVISAIFGTSILRDFQRDTYQLIFTKPISKVAYLGGRWAGSFVTTVAVFTGIPIGVFAGTFAPWADHSRMVSRPPLVVCTTFPLHHGSSNLLPGVAVLLRGCADTQDLHRLSPGRDAVHAVSHRAHSLQHHAQP